MISKTSVLRCARNAVIIATIVTIGAFLSIVLGGLARQSSLHTPHSGLATFGIGAGMFASTFSIFFVWNLVSVARAQPVYDILEQESPPSELLRAPLYGFVAMEFYFLILNRTFVVLVGHEGLYGWKTAGLVTNANRTFYEPWQDLVADEEFTRDLPAIRKLAKLPGGFFYPASEIAAVTSDDRQQWGMGGIANTGHVHLRFASGTTRKLILLGAVDPDRVRERILSAVGSGIPS